MKIDCQLDYNRILEGHSETVHLAIIFKADKQPGERGKPFAFEIVLDNSGSMTGAPLEHARDAAKMVVRHLRAEDRFGLVVFSDSARTVVPFHPAENKAAIEQLISNIQPEGSTNLTGGWMLGRDEVRQAPEGFPRKLLLLTDGHLNVGIVDPPQVAQIVNAGLQQDAVRTSCLGFSDAYNEDLLAALAQNGGGALHDADSPENFPAIFQQELESLLKLSVQNLRVRIRRLHYCSGVELYSGYPFVPLFDGGIEIAVGDLVSEEERALVLALEVLPLPKLPDDQPIATLRGEALLDLEFLFDEIRPDGVVSRKEQHTVRVLPAQNAEDVRVNEQAVEWVAVQSAGNAIKRAISHRDRDELAEVKALIETAIARLRKYNCPEKIAEALGNLEAFLRASENWDFRMRKISTSTAYHSSRSSSFYIAQREALRKQQEEQRQQQQGQNPPPADPPPQNPPPTGTP